MQIPERTPQSVPDGLPSVNSTSLGNTSAKRGPPSRPLSPDLRITYTKTEI